MQQRINAAGSVVERSHSVPLLAPPPRPVPWVVQWHLFNGRPLLAIGLLFIVVSSAFLHALWTNAGGWVSWWQVFPMIHLSVGLGLTIVPVILWRRRVAILKHGQLARARIVETQNRGGTLATDKAGATPWLDYQRAFEPMRAFWKTRLHTPVPLPGVIIFFRWVLAFFGLLGVLWTILVLTVMWVGNHQGTLNERVLGTLGILAFMAVWFGVLWFLFRCVAHLCRLIGGEITPRTLGMQPVCTCRVVFADSAGKEIQASVRVDLRSRLEQGHADPEDLALYLPSNPQRALLLGGLYPPITIRDGELITLTSSTGEE